VHKYIDLHTDTWAYFGVVVWVQTPWVPKCTRSCHKNQKSIQISPKSMETPTFLSGYWLCPAHIHIYIYIMLVHIYKCEYIFTHTHTYRPIYICIVFYLSISIALLMAWAFQKRSQLQQLILSEFICWSTRGNCKWRTYPKLEHDSNPRPSGRKASTQPMRYHAPLII